MHSTDAIDCRWDDGTFVVDPASACRAAIQRANDPGSDGDTTGNFPLNLGVPSTGVTLEEWQVANGYDPVTRTYA